MNKKFKFLLILLFFISQSVFSQTKNSSENHLYSLGILMEAGITGENYSGPFAEIKKTGSHNGIGYAGGLDFETYILKSRMLSINPFFLYSDYNNIYVQGFQYVDNSGRTLYSSRFDNHKTFFETGVNFGLYSENKYMPYFKAGVFLYFFSSSYYNALYKYVNQETSEEFQNTTDITKNNEYNNLNGLSAQVVIGKKIIKTKRWNINFEICYKNMLTEFSKSGNRFWALLLGVKINYCFN